MRDHNTELSRSCAVPTGFNALLILLVIGIISVDNESGCYGIVIVTADCAYYYYWKS
ncbi:hypothetical protein DFP73DRAFT_555259 [Morchella snyderi]|nr:hypothetical protein DFP73DRAFT_555259 [Morchella snyderi]